MPLYTYIVSYDGEARVTQAQRSNFQGFADWIEALPKSLVPKVKKELGSKIYAGFEAVPNREKVWCREIKLDGKDLLVFAIETKS